MVLTHLTLFSFFNGASRSDAPPPPPVVDQPGGGSSRRKKRGRVIRFSDLDERERQEALAAIPVRPFTEIEQAAVNLSEAEGEDETEDDELILMALMRVFH